MEIPSNITKRSQFREWADDKNEQIRLFDAHRQASYPPLHIQLDMLWHDMDLELIPGKGGSFYNTRKKVKDIIAKPPFDMKEWNDMDFSGLSLEEDLD